MTKISHSLDGLRSNWFGVVRQIKEDIAYWDTVIKPSSFKIYLVTIFEYLQGGSNITGTDLCVNKPHCAAAVRPWKSEATTSTLPPARVRTSSVLSGSC